MKMASGGGGGLHKQTVTPPMYSSFAHGDDQQVTWHEALTSKGAKYEKFMSIFGLKPSALTPVETALSPGATTTRAQNARVPVNKVIPVDSFCSSPSSFFHTCVWKL